MTGNTKKIRKTKQIAGCISCLLMLLVTISAPLIVEPANAQTSTSSETFRPFYSGYAKGTVGYTYGANWTTADSLGVTREWNFESWNVSSLSMTIKFAMPWYKKSATGWDAPFDLTLYFSLDNGATFTDSVEIEVPWLQYVNEWTTNWYYADFVYEFDESDYSLFTPATRIQFSADLVDCWICNCYWGAAQSPVPPYDYLDGSDNFVQYHVLFHVDYTEDSIDYIGESLNMSAFPITEQKLTSAASMIINCMQPSGATDEFTDKIFGRDSYIVIYSAQLGFYELMDACAMVDNETRSQYLVAARRFLVWMWSKQNTTDGSFPFILTDGDQHPWYNATADLWYGRDKIDSFSALAISCMWKYHNVTGDLDFINEYWTEIAASKTFVTSLVNETYWLPVDGYHYDNDTGFVKSNFNWLHDSCEAYQGLIDYALLESARGNSSEYTYWTNYANSIATGIRTYFWNETLGRYTGMFFIENATQSETLVYNIITPLIYGIETNVTRGSLTLNTYLTWGILSGRYYDVDYAADYSIYNEYATMSGMTFSAIARLINDFDYYTPYLKTKFLDISEFLFCNPIHPALNLQNSDGFLDWTNHVNYTQAVSYARLIETSAWFIDGFMNLQNMSYYYVYTAAQLAALQEVNDSEMEYWITKHDAFYATYGFAWNHTADSFDCFVDWMKSEGEYVEWHDWLFERYLLEMEYLNDLPWWENWTPEVGWWYFFVYGSTHGFYVLCLGIAGACMMLFSPCWFALKLREGLKSGDEIMERLVYSGIIFLIGFCLVASWLGVFS